MLDGLLILIVEGDHFFSRDVVRRWKGVIDNTEVASQFFGSAVGLSRLPLR